MRGRWFLHRRITAYFAATAFLLSLTLAIPFGLIVSASIHEEIEGLVREEREETQAYMHDVPSRAELAEIIGELVQGHDEEPLAWRILDSDGTLWGEFGDTSLLRELPASWPAGDVVVAPRPSLRICYTTLEGPRRAAIVIDCSERLASLDRALLIALFFGALGVAVATLAGHLLGRRVAGLLAEVARTAATHEGPGPSPLPERAPEEIREVVHALQDTLRRIKEGSEKARLMANGMAHELRSPLQNLIGEIQVALLRERDGVEYRRVLESQLEELLELSRAVDNLLTMASMEEALRRRTVEAFDLEEEVRLRMGREQGLARRKGVELTLRGAGPLHLRGDREALLLALRNVLTNAIEWSPAGGPVEVRMGRSNGSIEVLVDDSGPGVPAASREVIFEPFHEGPAAQGRRVGFGLGLALAQGVVRAEGGSIEVLDSPLGGARFRILIPAEEGDDLDREERFDPTSRSRAG